MRESAEKAVSQGRGLAGISLRVRLRWWWRKFRRKVADQDVEVLGGGIGLHFEGKDVQLDCGEFLGCTFKDCTLRYRGGPLVMDTAKITNCKWVMEGPASDTVVLLRLLYRTKPDMIVELLEDENDEED